MRNDPAMMTGNLGYERTERDHYPTETWVTDALIDEVLNAALPAGSSIWEPACGTGEMVLPLRRKGWDVLASDIHDYGFAGTLVADFLTDNPFEMVAPPLAIVTNPPYIDDLPVRFVMRALELVDQTSGIVAMVMRHEWDSASTRLSLVDARKGKLPIPFAGKLTLTSRPRWIPGSKGSPRHNYDWYIWSAKHVGAPVLRYHVRRG